MFFLSTNDTMVGAMDQYMTERTVETSNTKYPEQTNLHRRKNHE